MAFPKNRSPVRPDPRPWSNNSLFSSVYEESFSLLDKDGDGNITNYEIRSLMNSLGYSPSEEDISTVISKIDIDGNSSPSSKTFPIFTISMSSLGNGSVDFDEFLTMMRKRRSAGEIDTELQHVFNVKSLGKRERERRTSTLLVSGFR